MNTIYKIQKLILIAGILFSGWASVHAEQNVFGANADDPATMMDYVATPSGSDAIPQSSDLETTILANSVKLGEGGVNDHIDFFEDYGETVLLTNGNIVSVWRARDNASATPSTPDGDGYGVFFRILSPAGAQVAGPVAPYLDINPDGTGDQNRPFVTALTGGGFAMTWNSNGGPGDLGSDTFSGGDTYVRVYDDEGQPVSGTLKVNETQPSGVDDHQFPEAMIGLSDGGFAVVWRDDNNNTGNKDDFFVRSFDADGTPRETAPVWGRIMMIFFERLGNAVALEDGRFAISWGTDDPVWGTPDSPGADGDLDGAAFFRVFNADGSGFTDPIRPYLSINPTGQGHQWELSLTTLADGNLALAWNSVNGPGDVFDDGFGYGGDTYTAVFTPAGDLVGSVVKVNDLHDDAGETPVVIKALPFGGYAVVWLRTDPSQFDYFVRVHEANGAAVNPSVRVSPDSDLMFEDFGNLAVLSDGGFVLGLRIRDTNNNGTGDSVDGEGFAAGLRVFNADGTARTDLFFPYLDINPDGSGSQNSPLISSDPWGGFAVTWNSAGNDNDGVNSDFGAGGNSTSGGDTWTRFYDNQGLPLVDTLRAHPSIPDEVTGTVDEQRPMDIVVISAGQWAVVFRDENNFNDNKDDMFVSVFSVTGRMDQTLDFPAITDQTAGDEVILDASATSGLPVSYSVSGPADLNGTTLTFTGGGVVTVTAMQAGNVSWNPADPVVRTFTVGASSPLELVIDLGTEEIYLTGEYTSPEVTVDADSFASYRLGLNDWVGGFVVEGDVLSVTASSPFLWINAPNDITVSSNQDDLYIGLGDLDTTSEPATTITIEVLGNNEVRSFASLNVATKTYLAALDAESFYFQEDRQNIAVAGTIRVRGPNLLETVLVGDAGNNNDTTGFGRVDYEFYIGKFLVTNAQYAAFLNAVASSDPHGLWNSNMGSNNNGGISRDGIDGSYTYSTRTNMGNKPVNYVSFWDAARFTNWLTSGDTEVGVYNLGNVTNPTNNTITRDATAWANGGVAIASENEWYKAAYFSGANTGSSASDTPNTSGYWLYPTQSNMAPTQATVDSAGDVTNPGANVANYGGSKWSGGVTSVGSAESGSYYGTFDQGGNLWELNDEILFTSNRGLRGGSFGSGDFNLQSSFRFSSNAASEFDFVGFRVSSLNPLGEVPSLVVTTTADVVNPMDGHTSLREAIAYAATLGGQQTITFSDSNENGAVNFHDGNFRVITLGGEELVISSDVTIIGPGAELLVVSGNNASRVLRIEADTEVTLEHLSLRRGNAAENGGGIHNAGTLVLREIGMAFHNAVANGGAIYNSGDLEVHGSRFFLNSASGSGGAIYHSGGTGNLTIETTFFEQNSSFDGGAIYSFNSAQFSVNQSTFSDNSASGEGGAIYLRFTPQAVVTNSTFAYQISSSPLWIADSSTDLTLRHVTLVEPTGSLRSNGGSLSLQNTLLVGEMADGFTDNGGNLIVELEIQAGLELNVGTAVLADNGGPTPTVALVAGSPALFAAVPSAVMVDQRGIARPDGFAPDIGAFEAEGNASVTLSDLTQTFDGDEKTVSFTTDPTGLDVQVTYNGSTEAPVDAGTYTVRAVTTTAGTFGGATGTLTIGKANQTITFGEIADQFINASLTLGATASSGLPVSYSIDGPAVLDGTTLTFNGTGTVTVTASQAGDDNWNEAVSVGQSFEVTKVPATVTLSDLTQTFDNDPKPVTVTTNPDSLDVTVTYEGETTPPTNAGTYAVVATVDSATFEGSASDTLVINPADQTITFLPLDDVLSTDTVNLTATATSGLPVSYSVSGPAILAGNSLTFTGPGVVTVTATQSGNTNWNEADPVEQSFTVGAPSQLELVIDLGREELFLTGEYTSPEVTVPADSDAMFRLGLNQWQGGAIISGDVLSVTAASSSFRSDDFRDLAVAGTEDSLFVELGDISTFEDPATTTIEVLGNDEVRSFASLTSEDKAFLATLDGRSLQFQELRSPGTYQDIAVAGTIRVRGPNRLETVLVGDADNPDDTTGYGGVDYEFYIGKFPVTNAQYAAFLNAVAANGDPHELWNPSMGSSVHGGISRNGAGTTEDPFVYRVRTATAGFNNDQSMGNRPVNFVSFWDAARFTNWLTSGDTEIGVYPLGNVTNPTNNTITRDATAWANGGIAVAGENEWYKAAYYDPTLNSGSGGYWLYPAQSDSAPTATIPNNTDPNSVNQSGSLSPEGNTVTPAGGYTLSNSYYGTFDQGGNVWEWNDEILFSLSRGLRGGSFSSFDNTLRSSLRSSSNPSQEDDDIGFRITSLNPPLAEVPSLVVTTTADIVNPNDGHTSLREAIAYAAGLGGQQTITFSDANENGAINFHDGTARTLLLDGTELVSLSDISIVGPGEERLTISGDQRSRILTVETGDTVSISGLSFAEGAGEEQGGAIRNFGTLTLTDTSFVDNGAMGSGIIDGPPIDGPPPGEGEGPIDGGPDGPLSLEGGAIYNEGELAVHHSTFLFNSSSIGGALMNRGSLTIDESVFFENESFFGGAILNEGDLSITGSTLAGNSASLGGGALASDGQVSLVNTTFVDNNASDGGAILNVEDGEISVSFVTFASNDADEGSAFFNEGTLTLRNTLLAGTISGPWTDDGNNLIVATPVEAGLAVNAVERADLTDNGGLTPTVALLSGSQALAAGGELTGIDTDQRGVARPQGSAPDIGAFERPLDPQEITFDEIATQVANTPLNLAASASSGLPVVFVLVDGPATLDGSTLIFSGEGTVQIQATQPGNPSFLAAAPVTRSFAVEKAVAEVTITDLNQTFTGAPRPVTVTTVPDGLAVEITYDGSSDAPSAAGSYPVVATVVSDIYEGSATGTLIIGNAPQTITFDPEPDLNPLANAVVTLTATASSGLPVSLDITSGPGVLTSGNELSFTAADVVVVTATQDGDDDWDPASPVELTFNVSKAPATVTITDLDRIFTGDPIEVTVTTDPVVQTVMVTYDGETDAPTAVGSYTVVATIDDPIYEGSATETLTIAEVPSLIVTTLDDVIDPTDGQTSLREAIAYAATLTGPQTITFSDTEANGAVNFHDGTFRTITLGGTQLTISSDVTIEGPGADLLGISGNNQSRVFEFTPDTTSTLSDLVIQNGNGSDGGGIFNRGNLMLIRMAIRSNNGIRGGGIFTSQGQLEIFASEIAENTVDFSGQGGGIFVQSGTVDVQNSTVAKNISLDLGGALYNEGGVVTLFHSTLAGNEAADMQSMEIFSITEPGIEIRLQNTIVTGEMTGDPVNWGNNLLAAMPSGAGLEVDGSSLPLLENNGGTTRTVALLGGSPALAAAEPLAGITTDQRGVARPQGSAPDIGAFERPLDTQEIIFDEIATQVANTPLNLAASASSGLPVVLVLIDGPATLDGSTLTFSGEGTVQIQATQPGNPSFLAAAPVTRSFAVEKAVADVTITDLNQTFTGEPRPVTVTTVPADLTVEVTYDGSSDAPSAAGSYPVVATVVSDIYEGSATGTLIIGNAPQTITFDPEPDLNPLANAVVTLTATASSGLPVSFAVTSGPGVLTNGNELSFTAADVVVVTATQDGDDDWDPASPVELTFNVSKTPATVTIADLDRIFTGDPIEVTFTTDPVVQTVMVTYDGETDAPTAVGSYTVVATIDDPIYEGSATETLTIAEVPSLIVTTLDDVIDPTDGQTSLREAIAYAATLTGPQTITFSDTEANGAVNFHDGTFRTITLNGTQLTVSSDVTIEGPGADLLGISGNNQSRVFEFLSNTTSTLSGLGIIEGNSIGTGEGGGILNNGGSLLVDFCRIVGNSASNGGGISTRNGQLTVRDSTLSENTAVTNGGGISIFSGTATILRSTIADNMAESGGGVYSFTLSGDLNSSPATIIRNSTLSGNTADSSFAQRGGGLANFNGVTEITFSTITANIGEGSSGIFSFNDSVTVTRIGQSIVAGNVGPELRGQNTIQRFVSLGHNLIGVAGDNVDFTQDFTETGDQTGITEPLLGPLADNGGQTLTHALLEGSPAIGASVVVAGVDTDQRGVPRPQGDNPDIGAYERGLSPQTIDFPAIAEQLAPVPLTLSATASSSLEVTFEVLGGPATLAGNTLTFTGEGSVQVQATQVGNSEFLPAAPVVRSFEVVKANASIFLAGLTQTFNGSPRAVNVSTIPVGLNFVKTYDGLPDLPVNAGTYPVSVEVVDDFYEGVITDIQFTIQRANQTITFAEIDDQIVNQSISLTATAGSGLGIGYSVDGPASLSGNTLTVTGTGLIEVTASQEGDNNWNAAEPVTRSFTGLEVRSLIVTTVNDVVDETDGQTSLREAIAYAATLDGPQTITFSDTDANGAVNFHDGTFRTITLGGTQLTVTSDVTIEGPGADVLAISGNEQSRVMFFTTGTTSTVEGLTLTQGATDASGGGIVSEWASLTLTRMTISNNQADDLGGGVHHFNGTLNVNQSTISGNSAFRGGGIHTQSAAGSATDPAGIMIRNSTISGNTATDRGGAVRNVSGVMEITHSTLTSNTANSGGGVWSWNDGDTATRIGQSIVAGNSGGELVGFFTLQPYVSLGHNLIGQDVVNVDFNIEFNETGDQTGIADPLLGPLADNGGPTLTHALLPGSPAIGASVVVAGVDTDQRGVARPQGVNPDIGAYERELDQQTIDFPEIADPLVNATITLSATADSGLPVAFEVLEGPAVLDGNTLTFTETGPVMVQASQAGNAEFLPANPVSRSFTVLPPPNVHPPVISNLDGDEVSGLPGVAIRIDEGVDALVTDEDEFPVSGGRLLITPTSALVGTFSADGTVVAIDGGVAFVTGETVTVNGVVIGEVVQDGTSAPLEIALNDEATPERLTLVLRELFYTSNDPGSHTFDALVNDGDFDSNIAEFTVVITAMLTPEVTVAPVLNRQNGLFESTVTVTNPHGVEVPGFVLRILNLPSDVVVWNANGTDNDLPAIFWNQPLGPGENVSFLVEFYRPNRNPDFDPQYEAEFIPPPPAPPEEGGTPFQVDRFFRMPNGDMVLDWFAEPGRSYAVEYSTDMVNWIRVQPTLTAVANQLRWIDNGPPKTASHPSEAGSRFYRVILLNP